MKYCTECGSKRSEGQAFCTECGASFAEPHTEPESVQQAHSQDSQPPAAKKPMPERTKIILSVGGAVLLILLGAYQWLSHHYDPMKVLQEMDRAIVDDDSKAFLKHIDFDKEALLNETAYFDYIKQHEWEQVKPQLLELIESKSQAPFDFTVKSKYGADLYKVIKKRKFGLFSTYSFRAVPAHLMVSTTVDDTVVAIDKQEWTAAAEKPAEIKKIYPGVYAYEAQAENLFGDFSEQAEVEVAAKNDNELFIEFPYEVYTIESDQMDAILFVNGKSTKKTLKELQKVGPFPEKEVKMHAEWTNPQGKVMKTKTVTQHDAFWGTIFFEFGYESDIDEFSFSAGDHVLNFRDAYEQALNSKDYQLIEPFIEAGSAAEKELKKFVADLEKLTFHYEFTENVILDTEFVDDGMYRVTTKETFTYTHYEKDKEEVTDYEREKVYHVKATDDGYKITKIDYKQTDRNKH